MQEQGGAVSLTAKQQQTLDLLLQGRNAKQIAKLSGVTPSAVTQRIEGLLRKAGCADKGELIRWQQARMAARTAAEEQVGRSTEMPARSTAERITADLDHHSERVAPARAVLIEKAPDPEASSQQERVRARIEWLGYEVTWLQMILLLALLAGTSFVLP